MKKKILLIAAILMSIGAMAQGSNATTFVRVTPALTTTTMVPGYVLGGIQTLTASAYLYNSGATLKNVSGSDKKNNKPGVDLYIFSQSPSHGTYTNGVAYTADSTDMTHYLSTIHVLTSSWTTQSTYATFSLSNLEYSMRCTGNNNNLYVVPVSTGTFTPTTTTDLTFGFGFKQD